MLRPIGDKIVAKAISAEEMSPGGIVLPESAQEKPLEGEVLAVGPGQLLDTGKYRPIDVKVGDKVIYGKYAGTEVKFGAEEYIILRQDDILAIIE